jgi:type IV pilus assembly protein PilE
MKKRLRQPVGGFHLLELLLVCGLVSLMLLFAVPSFITPIQTVKRQEAKVMLLRYAAALERYYFQHMTYQGATSDLLHLPSLAADGQYHITITSEDDEHYVLRAVPQGAQAKRDSDCKILTINEAGERGTTGEKPVVFCWG